jgi:prephenate dehydrogenase
MKIGIVGLGLIGGSLAKRFKEVIEHIEIEGCDSRLSTIAAAVEEGVITKGVQTISDLSKHLDIVFVCTPISVTVETMKAVAAHVSSDTIVTDVASVKRTITRETIGQNMVPGHPIAGTQFSGFEASDASIMQDANYVLIPTPQNQHSVSFLSTFLRTCGFSVSTMSADAHDESLAATSHIPYLFALALKGHAEKLNISDVLKGPGFKSATRVADMPASWGDEVLEENGDIIREQLGSLIDALNQYR